MHRRLALCLLLGFLGSCKPPLSSGWDFRARLDKYSCSSDETVELQTFIDDSLGPERWDPARFTRRSVVIWILIDRPDGSSVCVDKTGGCINATAYNDLEWKAREAFRLREENHKLQVGRFYTVPGAYKIRATLIYAHGADIPDEVHRARPCLLWVSPSSKDKNGA